MAKAFVFKGPRPRSWSGGWEKGQLATEPGTQLTTVDQEGGPGQHLQAGCIGLVLAVKTGGRIDSPKRLPHQCPGGTPSGLSYSSCSWGHLGGEGGLAPPPTFAGQSGMRKPSLRAGTNRASRLGERAAAFTISARGFTES